MELLRFIQEYSGDVATAISVLRLSVSAERGIRALLRRYRARRESPSE